MRIVIGEDLSCSVKAWRRRLEERRRTKSSPRPIQRTHSCQRRGLDATAALVIIDIRMRPDRHRRLRPDPLDLP